MEWSVSLCFQRLNGNLQILCAFSVALAHLHLFFFCSFSSFLVFSLFLSLFAYFFLFLHLLFTCPLCVSACLMLFMNWCCWCCCFFSLLSIVSVLFPFLLHLQRPHFIVDAIARFFFFHPLFPAFILLSLTRARFHFFSTWLPLQSSQLSRQMAMALPFSCR